MLIGAQWEAALSALERPWAAKRRPGRLDANYRRVPGPADLGR